LEQHVPLPKKYLSYKEKKVSEETVPRNVEYLKWIKANTRAKSVGSAVDRAFDVALQKAAPKAGGTVTLKVYDLTAPKGTEVLAQYVHVKGKASDDILVWEDDTIVDVKKLKDVRDEFMETVLNPTVELQKNCRFAEDLFAAKEELLEGKGTLFMGLAAAVKGGDDATVKKLTEKIELELDATRAQVGGLIRTIGEKNRKSDGAQRAGIAPLREKYDLTAGEEKVVNDYFMESTKAIEEVRTRLDALENRLDLFLIKRTGTLAKVTEAMGERLRHMTRLTAIASKHEIYVEHARAVLKSARLEPNVKKGLLMASKVMDDAKALRDQIETYKLTLTKIANYGKEANVLSTAAEGVVAKFEREPNQPFWNDLKQRRDDFAKELADYDALVREYLKAFNEKMKEYA
jgi:hypothetical protein